MNTGITFQASLDFDYRDAVEGNVLRDFVW